MLGAGDAAAQNSCAAETRVPTDWALIPADVSAGDKFRLMFITDGTISARAGVIGHYNSFVQNEAGRGHAAIRFYKGRFRALGSTSADDARDNTCTSGSGGENIYWLNGNKVVDNNADLYDGDWDDESNPKNEDGNAWSGEKYWTGSDSAGRKVSINGNDRWLGAVFVNSCGYLTCAAAGQLNVSGDDPLSVSFENIITNGVYKLLPMIAVSRIFRVPTSSEALRTTGLKIISTPPAERTYLQGEGVRFEVTFSETVNVRGSPELALGPKNADEVYHRHLRARYLYGSGTTKLVFAWTVPAGETDDDGLDTVDGPVIRLEGGAITAVQDGLPFVDRLPAYSKIPTHDGNVHKVDGTRLPDYRNSTGEPSIVGSPFQGQVIRVTRGNIDDPNGVKPYNMSFSFYRCDANGDNCDTRLAHHPENAGLVSGLDYTITAADVGRRIRAEVGFRDLIGHWETRRSFPWPPLTKDPIAAALGCAAATLTGRTVIWKGDMTVGARTGYPDQAFSGYHGTISNPNATYQPGIGRLTSPRSFNYLGVNYAIDGAFALFVSDTSKLLTLSLDKELLSTAKANLQFHVCEEGYSLSSAILNFERVGLTPPGTTDDYVWLGPDGIPSPWPTNSYLSLKMSVPLNKDPSLSAMSIDPGRLLPEFIPTVQDYTSTVGVSRITVTPTPNASSASVSYFDGNDSPLTDADPTSSNTFQVDLAAGDNVIKVKVTAGDGNLTQTYTLSVERVMPPANCDATNHLELWCATLTVGTRRGRRFGYRLNNYGSFAPARTFIYRSARIGLTVLENARNNLSFAVARTDGTTPADGLLGAGNFSLEIGTDSTKKSFAIDNPETTESFNFLNQGLSWAAGDTVLVKLLKANNVPTVANAIRDQLAPVGKAFSYQFPDNTFSDEDRQSLTYTATKADGIALPTWLTFVAGTRTFSGTPQTGDAGTVSVEVTADDGSGGSVSDEYDIIVIVPASHCDASNPFELWCATLTVGSGSGATGYDGASGANIGSLAPIRLFPYRTAVIAVDTLAYTSTDLDFSLVRNSGTTPAGGLLGADSFSLDIGTGADRKFFLIENPGTGTDFSFSSPGLSWSASDTVPVKLLGPFRSSTQPWGGQLDAPPGTTALLRARWLAPVDATGVLAYHLRYRIVGSNARPRVRRVNVDQREFLERYLAPGTTYEGQICTVTEINSRSLFWDTLGPCSGWSRLRLPERSEANANDFTLSLELPDGSSSKATVAWNGTLAYRIRVSGVNDSSVLEFPTSTVGIAATRLGPPGERIPEFTPYDSNSESDFTYRGFARKFIVWDSLTSGYWERTQTVWTGVGPNESHVLELIDQPARFFGSRMLNRIGAPSSLCVEITDSTDTVTAPCADQQVEVEPATIEGTPDLSESDIAGEWTEGDNVEVTLTFSEAVEVETTNGIPSIDIGLGGPSETRSAGYLRGSATTELVFGYTLAQGDGNHNAMAVMPNTLVLNGGTIWSVGTDTDANLEHVGTVVRRRTGRNTERPSARFGGVPASHDGSSPFTVELHFSAEPEGLSYRTVQGGLLEVEGATVTRAARTTKGSNQGWRVTVAPSGDGDVQIGLPARKCGKPNAVCIGGKPLAQAAQATIPGTAQVEPPHSNPSQHRPRPGSPPILQAHFRMGLDCPRQCP